MQLAGVATAVLYTVPSLKVFRGDLVCSEVNNAAPITFTMRINGTRWLTSTLAAGTFVVVPIPVCLNAGDVLNLSTLAGGGTVAVTGFGSLLVN